MPGYEKLSTSDFNKAAQLAFRSKVEKVEKVYERWGKILMLALREESPSDTNKLRGNIDYEVRRHHYRGVVTSVKLLVGIFGKSSKSVNYLRFILQGTQPHVVSFKTAPGLLKWALRHNLVYESTSKQGSTKGQRVYRFSKGPKAGKVASALPLRGWPDSYPSGGYKGELEYMRKRIDAEEHKIRKELEAIIFK